MVAGMRPRILSSYWPRRATNCNRQKHHSIWVNLSKRVGQSQTVNQSWPVKQSTRIEQSQTGARYPGTDWGMDMNDDETFYLNQLKSTRQW